MHSFAKMPLNMLEFGSVNNFSGNRGEWALKGIVKDHSEKTQRQPDTFAEKCAICKYESQSNVIKYVMTDTSSQISVYRHSSKIILKCGNLEEGLQFTFEKQITGE